MAMPADGGGLPGRAADRPGLEVDTKIVLGIAAVPVVRGRHPGHHFIALVWLGQSADPREDILLSSGEPITKKLQGQLSRARDLGFRTCLAIDQRGSSLNFRANFMRCGTRSARSWANRSCRKAFIRRGGARWERRHGHLDPALYRDGVVAAAVRRGMTPPNASLMTVTRLTAAAPQDRCGERQTDHGFAGRVDGISVVCGHGVV